MLAHREARSIALGTEAKLRILAELLAQHYPEQTLIFTNDNATVYRISQTFLIPAITHQTPVKERHAILQQFREGTYKTLVASHVLNEGVDVPEANVAILLSGTGSAREYIQRLGRVLRKGKTQKVAVLYEVVAEETTEESVSRRRRQPTKPSTQPRNETNQRSPQFEILPFSPYPLPSASFRAAESPEKWQQPNLPSAENDLENNDFT
jgi:superfamily II DNA or RNA helicase